MVANCVGTKGGVEIAVLGRSLGCFELMVEINRLLGIECAISIT